MFFIVQTCWHFFPPDSFLNIKKKKKVFLPENLWIYYSIFKRNIPDWLDSGNHLNFFSNNLNFFSLEGFSNLFKILPVLQVGGKQHVPEASAVGKESSCQPKIPYLVKTALKKEGQRGMFSDKLNQLICHQKACFRNKTKLIKYKKNIIYILNIYKINFYIYIK